MRRTTGPGVGFIQMRTGFLQFLFSVWASANNAVRHILFRADRHSQAGAVASSKNKAWEIAAFTVDR